MLTRHDEPPEKVVKPTRVVGWNTAVGLASAGLVGVVGVAWGFYTAQLAQNATSNTKLEHINENLNELKAEVKSVNIQLSSKSAKDAEQDAKHIDIERRVTRLENRQ